MLTKSEYITKAKAVYAKHVAIAAATGYAAQYKVARTMVDAMHADLSAGSRHYFARCAVQAARKTAKPGSVKIDGQDCYVGSVGITQPACILFHW